MSAKLRLDLEGGLAHELPATALLVFLDETGDESLTNPAYPLFGLGGIVVRCDEYVNRVGPSWQMMKADVLGHAGAAYHATDLTHGERQRAGEWFAGPGALNVGVAGVAIAPAEPLPALETTSGVPLRADEANFGLVYESLTRCFWDVWRAKLFSQIDFLIEDSARGRKLVRKFILPWEAASVEDGQVVPMKLTHYLVPKIKRAPGLEIADHVARAAGKQAHLGPGELHPDFDAAFRRVSSRNASFKVIQGVRAGA